MQKFGEISMRQPHPLIRIGLENNALLVQVVR